MADIADGRLFEAGSSRNGPARLARRRDGLRLETDAGVESLDAGEVRSVSPPLGRTPRRILLADGRLFETGDSAAVDRLFPAARGRLSAVRGWRLGALAAATVAAVAALVVVGVPVGAGIAASLTPQSVRGFIDDGALASLETIGLVTRDEAHDLPDAFAAMLRAAGEEPSRYRLLVLDAPRIGANAFALPGGTVVVTTDLLDLLDRDEVLAVLAHEVGHVDGDHGLQLLYRALGLRAVVDGLTGGAGAAVDVMAENAAAVLSLQNTRDFEREADAAAVGILLAAGRDPVALATALETIAADCPACGEGSFLSTHPGIAERAATIRELAAAARPGGQTAR